MIRTLLKRDLKLAFRSIYAVFGIFAFYLIGSFIFMFAFSQDVTLVTKTFPAVILINAVMAGILTIPELIRRDYENKVLEQIYLQSVSMEKIVLSKIISHWLITGLPLTIFAAISSMFVSIEAVFDVKVTVSILLASPVISIIAVMTSCITLGVRNGGVIASVIAIPLYVPVILFTLLNISSSETVEALFMASANILGLLLLLLPLCIFAGGFSLKLALED